MNTTPFLLIILYIEFSFTLKNDFTKRPLKNVDKQDLIIMVLNMQTECDRLVELIGKNIDELSYKVDDLTYKFIVVESCLVISKKVSSSFVQRE